MVLEKKKTLLSNRSIKSQCLSDFNDTLTKIMVFLKVGLWASLFLFSACNQSRIKAESSKEGRSVSSAEEIKYSHFMQSDLDIHAQVRTEFDFMYEKILSKDPNYFINGDLSSGAFRKDLASKLLENYSINPTKNPEPLNLAQRNQFRDAVGVATAELVEVLQGNESCEKLSSLVQRVQQSFRRHLNGMADYHRKHINKEYRVCRTCTPFKTGLYTKYILSRARYANLSIHLDALLGFLILHQEAGDPMINTDGTFEDGKFCYPKNFPKVLEKFYNLNQKVREFSHIFNGSGPRNYKNLGMAVDLVRKNMEKRNARMKVAKVAGIFIAMQPVVALAFARAGYSLWQIVNANLGLVLGEAVAVAGIVEAKDIYKRMSPAEYMGEVHKLTEEAVLTANSLYNQDIELIRGSLMAKAKVKRSLKLNFVGNVETLTQANGLRTYCKDFQSIIDGESFRSTRNDKIIKCTDCYIEPRLPKLCSLLD